MWCLLPSNVSYALCRESGFSSKWLWRSNSTPCSVESPFLIRFMHHFVCGNKHGHDLVKLPPHLSFRSTLVDALSIKRSCVSRPCSNFTMRAYASNRTNESIEMSMDEGVVRFNIGNQSIGAPSKKRKAANNKSDISRKAKLNELRFYRLKAKKKMNSPNPEVRIRYKLEKVGKKSFGYCSWFREFLVDLHFSGLLCVGVLIQ